MKQTNSMTPEELEKAIFKTEWSNVLTDQLEKYEMLSNLTEEEQNQYWQNKILNENHLDEMHELDDI